MKYLTEERFIVHSNTKEAQKNYRENWDRIFGGPEPEEQRIAYTGNVLLHDDGTFEVDATEEAARKILYERCIAAGWRARFPLEEKDE